MASAIIPNYSKFIIYYYILFILCLEKRVLFWYFDWQVQKDNKIISCDSKVRFVKTLRHQNQFPNKEI